MNKEKQFNRMIDMIDSNIGTLIDLLNDSDLEMTTENLKNELIEIGCEYVLYELTTIIYTTKELTNITIEEINKHLIKEINMTYDDLREIEDSMI